jgi:hypothetical protein
VCMSGHSDNYAWLLTGTLPVQSSYLTGFVHQLSILIYMYYLLYFICFSGGDGPFSEEEYFRSNPYHLVIFH